MGLIVIVFSIFPDLCKIPEDDEEKEVSVALKYTVKLILSIYNIIMSQIIIIKADEANILFALSVL